MKTHLFTPNCRYPSSSRWLTHLSSLAFAMLVSLTSFSVDLHSSLCGETDLSINSKIKETNSTHNYYRIRMVWGSYDSGYEQYDGGTNTRPTFLDIAQTVSGFDIVHGETYSVTIQYSENQINWISGNTCTIAFVNHNQLKDNVCSGSGDINVLHGIKPKYQGFHQYKIYLKQQGSTDPPETIIFYNTSYTYFDFMEDEEFDIEYNTNYEISFTTWNKSSSVESPMGNTCVVQFSNPTKLVNGQCGDLDMNFNKEIKPKYAQYFYKVRATFSTSSTGTPVIGTPVEYSYPNYPLYSSMTGIDCNTTVYVLFEIKHYSTSDWSSFGPACPIQFNSSVDLGPDLTDCGNFELELAQNIIIEGYTNTFSWDDNNGWTSTSSNPTYTELGNNTVNVTVTNAGGCEATDAIDVTIVPEILYVDQSVNANNPDGFSWQTAYSDLQDALDNSCESMSIWVAEGEYSPTEYQNAESREERFKPKSGVALYGGFEGNEAANFDLDDRDLANTVTILSGDIDNTFSHNSHTIVYINNGTNNILDGFTITRSNGNHGDNPIYQRGGGVRVRNSTATISNCILDDNFVEGLGGGIYNQASDIEIINCLFTDNEAQSKGGGFCSYNLNGSVSTTITNCTFTGNTSNGFEAIERYNGGNITIENSIIWQNGSGNSAGGGNITASNTIYDGTNNIGTTIPGNGHSFAGYFVPATGSPAINNGDNAANDLNIDAAGNVRIQSTDIDMGCFESNLSNKTSEGKESATSEQNAEQTILVYPNPTSDMLNVKSNIDQNYQLVNQLGQVLMAGKFVEGVQQLDLSSFDSGVYYLISDHEKLTVVTQ